MLTSPRPFFLHSSANSCRVTASVFEPVEMRGGPLNIFDKSIISSSVRVHHCLQAPWEHRRRCFLRVSLNISLSALRTWLHEQISVPVFNPSPVSLGSYPAGAILQTLAFTSEYSPGPSQRVYSLTAPPMHALPATQLPHCVSVLAVHSAIWYFPRPHAAQFLHPATPALLISPLSHPEHSSAPPVDYVPAGQVTTPRRSDVGFFPAGVALQVARPSSSAYCPLPSHEVHSS